MGDMTVGIVVIGFFLTVAIVVPAILAKRKERILDSIADGARYAPARTQDRD